MRVFSDAIGPANRADSFVAFKNAIAQMARIAAQAPFFHAERGAERVPPDRHFKLAPTAETTAVRASGEIALGSPAARHDSFVAHSNRIELNGPVTIRAGSVSDLMWLKQISTRLGRTIKRLSPC